jgi:hypothetical protein
MYKRKKIKTKDGYLDYSRNSLNLQLTNNRKISNKIYNLIESNKSIILVIKNINKKNLLITVYEKGLNYDIRKIKEKLI